MFLMPWMLAGLLAVGIPVAIHLLHRQRTTPLKWGAMQFLVESKLQQKRRRKVDHWLLMLLRMAVIALLVFVLSRPLLVEGTYNPLGSALATDIGVVVDRSLSTGRRADGQSTYDRSVEALAELAKNMRPNDTLSIVLAEHRPQVQSVRLAPGKAADAPRKLKELGPGQSDASIPDAVRTARELIAEGRNARKMILVLSDEQRGNWAIDDNAAWQLAVGPRPGGAAAAPGTGVRLYSLPFVPDGKASDVAVSDLSIAPSVIGPGRAAQVTATLSNSGPDAMNDVTVQFLVDGQPAESRAVPSLPAGESRTVRFDHTFATPGSHWLKVQADVTDALDADNAAVIAANVWERLPVLIIDGQLTRAGDLRSSQFLAAAMQPVDPAPGERVLVQPKVVNVSDAADEKLDDYAVVVVNDAPRLPGELLTKLAAFARSGRGVWLIFGARTDADFIARDLGDAGLFLAAVKERKEPAGTQSGGNAPAAAPAPLIEVKDPGHPSVQLIAAAERNTLAGAVTRGWWSITSQSGDAKVILATSTGDPLVLERPIGNAGGRVTVWCTGVDTGWNNWPVLPHFVPLVNETLYHLAAGPARGLENRRLRAGQDLAWTGPPTPPVKRATLTRPDGQMLDLAPRLANGRQSLSYNDTFVPGLYELRFDQTAVPQPVYFGVGIDPRELDAAALAPSDHRWLAERGFLEKRLSGPGELPAAVGAVNKGREIWPLLAGVLLATLLFETFMTWRVMRHQAPAELSVA